MASSDKSIYTTVDALRPDTEGHSLIVKVLSSKPVDKPVRSGGRPATYAECLVGDESGCVLFLARNDQAETAQPNTYVELHNARVEMVQTSMRLVVPPEGSVKAAEGQKFTPKADFNLSDIEFELVLVPRPGEVAPRGPKAPPTGGSEDAANGVEEEDGPGTDVADVEEGFEAAPAPTDS